MECEQLALFAAEVLKLGDNVKVEWNECDLEYIKKSFPQLLTIGVVSREKLGAYDVQFGDYTARLIDKKMLNKI